MDVKPFFQKLTLALLTPILLLGLLEGGCRLFGLGRDIRYPETGEIEHYIAQWKRQWNGDFYLLKGPDANADGLRDYTHSVANTAGLVRVACLGDSVTYGFRQPRTNSYPAILETRARAAGHPAEVFNVALTSWSPRQERIAYHRIVRQYRPDYVFLGLCLNDIAEMQNNLYRPPALMRWAFNNSALVRTLLRPQAHEIYQVEELFHRPNDRRVRNGWRLCLNEIETLAHEVRADGARFALLVFFFRFQLEPHAPPPVPQQIIAEFCRRAEMDVLDLLPVLQRVGTQAFIDYDHLSRTGAVAVTDAILDSGLIQWHTKP